MTAAAATGWLAWSTEQHRADDLQHRVAVLQKQQQRLAVLRSVSKQMEEIAFQERDISDEQREEAILQRRKAEEMRQRSETERLNALIAQSQAVASEQRALEARQQAESQRQLAEQQRLQAELSKRMTDTLSYIALSRTLGTLSVVQAQLGNSELSTLLAYASYRYIKRYDGDLFYPSVFQSLMLASQSKRSWSRHKGSVMGMAYQAGEDRLVTISSYGEIFIHQKTGDQLKTTQLISNKLYDFRDLYIDTDKTIYVVSRSGHLLVSDGKDCKVAELPLLEHPMWITQLDNGQLLLIAERGLAVYDKQQKRIVATRQLDFTITTATRYANMPVLFDDRGRYHLVKNINKLITNVNPVKGRVTAFASSKNARLSAYGMSDGTIYLLNEATGSITKLQGHLSRVSKLKFNSWRLYSCSYDGTLQLWNTNNEKMEPMPLITSDSWIMSIAFDTSKEYAWIGDQNGGVTVALLSPQKMADIVKSNLKRNFTTEEWKYYIGVNVPYESFVEKQKAGNNDKQ